MDTDALLHDRLEEMGARLRRAGFGSARALKAFMDEGPDRVLDAVFPEEAVHAADLMQAVAEIAMHIDKAAVWEGRTRDTVSCKRLADALFAAGLVAKARRTEEIVKEKEVGGGPCFPRAVVKARCSWASGPGVASNHEQDSKERARWARRAIALLELGEVPALAEARRASDPQEALLGLLGGARAGTLRVRVRPWEGFVRWLQWRRARAWPQDIVDAIDYVSERMQDAPTGTFPTLFKSSLAWFEGRSGISVDDRLSSSDQLRLYLEKAAADVGCKLEAIRRAPRFPVAVVAAMEVAVVRDLEAPVALRIVWWMCLLKVWGVLRTDDIQRLRPDQVALGEAGLTGKLLRTKVSGPGKRIRELLLYIPIGAYMLDSNWLQVGFDLWRQTVDRKADFFLPRPVADWSGFTKKMATTADLAGIFTQALLLLRFRGTRVLPEALALSLTGHSERSTLTSFLAALGVPRAEREYLGRWSASGADEYVRTYRVTVRRLIALVSAAAGKEDAFAVFDEGEAFEALGERAVKNGLDPDAEDDIVKAAKDTAKTIFEALREKGVAEYHGEEQKDVTETAAATFDLGEDAGQDVDEKEESKAIYVSAEDQSRKFARIHLRHGCYLARGLAFKS